MRHEVPAHDLTTCWIWSYENSIHFLLITEYIYVDLYNCSIQFVNLGKANSEKWWYFIYGDQLRHWLHMCHKHAEFSEIVSGRNKFTCP